jgi:MFS family permease
VIDLLRRNPGFARLWTAQVVSQSGDWLNRIAVLTLIGSVGGGVQAAGVGALYGAELALRLLPSAVLGPLAGPIADRLPRRRVLVAADLLRALVVALMWLVREPAHLPWLYALIALQMGIAMFFDAARSAAIPDTVRREDLASAHTLSSATWSVMLSVGALVGGSLVGWLGVHPVFLVDSATYVGSALCLWGLRLPPVPAHAEPLRWGDVLVLRELRRGWRHALLGRGGRVPGAALAGRPGALRRGGRAGGGRHRDPVRRARSRDGHRAAARAAAVRP